MSLFRSLPSLKSVPRGLPTSINTKRLSSIKQNLTLLKKIETRATNEIAKMKESLVKWQKIPERNKRGEESLYNQRIQAMNDQSEFITDKITLLKGLLKKIISHVDQHEMLITLGKYSNKSVGALKRKNTKLREELRSITNPKPNKTRRKKTTKKYTTKQQKKPKKKRTKRS